MSKADEMFIQWGKENEAFETKINYYESYGCKSCQIIFIYSDSKRIIKFDSFFKAIRFDSENTSINFDYKILQAINEKCRELGWSDV